MKVEQIYTGCLAQGAYYVESNGEAVVIDPLREVAPYLERAKQDGAKIKYVLETHFHADFVSGHLDLAKESGGTIVYGPNANPSFPAHIAQDGEVLKVGAVTITVLHTPGHTMESTCYLLKDESGKPVAVFTGDTLFIGDVGRPDLAQKGNITQEDLAGLLYDSLHAKLMTLPDDVIVYPGHGAGSACGKKMSTETQDTIGNQKQTNYALRAQPKAAFIAEVTDGLMPPPAYFPENVRMNKQGYDSIETVLKRGTQALSPAAFDAAANETEALILDTRDAQTFAKGFIPNSINIGIDGNFAPWVGALIPSLQQPILLVTEPGREEEVVTRLARVGYDNAIGYLAGGFDAWKADGREVDTVTSIPATQLKSALEQTPGAQVLDVRKQSEHLSEHVIGAKNVPLDYINQNMAQVDPKTPYLVHCAGGYRSMIFISILKSRGYHNLVDVAGGFKAIKEAGVMPVSDYVCPTTLL
jgi:glyoxylase-like metal-dependent hydrolase (beta-lactamase superfamily II)/rhodanese-related sulfurtransferase